MFKYIKEKFKYNFKIDKKGIYVIEIKASCKSGKMLGFFGGEDLRTEIKNLESGSIIIKDKFNVPSAWNGTKLKGLSKTVIFIAELKKGKHAIDFIPKKGAILEEEPKIKLLKNNIIIKNLQAKDGNRRPFITIALLDLPLKNLDVSVICEKRFMDSDDVKLVINGEIQKNILSKVWGKNWYWRGSRLKGNEKTSRFYNDMKKNNEIEFWTDRMPIIKEVKININGNKKPYFDKIILRQYSYRGINGKENYNRYDNEIIEAVDYWNKEFKKYKYPPKAEKFLDPNLVKAMIYQESRVGYYSGGEIDVMQVGHKDDPGLKTLNGKLEEWYLDKNGKQTRLNYKGKANADSPKESIYWGVRWLYHKAQYIKRDGTRGWRDWEIAVKRYGPGTQKYIDSVWGIYTKGIAKEGKAKLWTLVFIPFLLLCGASFALYFNQGKFALKSIGHQVIYEDLGWEISILDGFRIKKGVFGLVDKMSDEGWRFEKNNIEVGFYDLDNDGKDEVLISAINNFNYEYNYFFEIGDKGLKRISVIDAGGYEYEEEGFYDSVIYFGPKDEFGRYTFVREMEGYWAGEFGIWRNHYKFNDKGEVAFFKEEVLPMAEDIIEEMKANFN